LSKREEVKRGGERAVEAVLDELYTTPPADFVARRDELAAAAKAAGNADDARRIRAARRPTLAAWAANLLLRYQPHESRQFLELGQALREAYRTLDAVEINELTEQRRRIVAALSRQAAQLAEEAGHRLSEQARQGVENTLRAVLTDPDAADRWAGGRLEGALTPPSDFPGTTPPTGTADKPRRKAAPQPTARARAKNELAERRRQRQELLDHARSAAEETAQRLRQARTEEDDAEAAWQRARDRHDQARQQVSTAEQQLQQAHEELQRAEREQQAAEERSHAAADAHAQARQEAREAEQEVKRLTARDR
jgi:DNA repair exonuclease SbcCD ATPase subunit